MNRLIVIQLLMLVCLNCKKKDSLKNNLLKEMNFYQKENNINNLLETDKKMYAKSHYLIHFDKINNDTVITLTLEPMGIKMENDDSIYGVYENNIIISDNKNLGSKYYKKTKNKLNNYTTDNIFISDLLYPVWIYQIKNDSLIILDKVGGNN
ncbi:hypothetical protein [Empedobacter brevis]|uniref:hypothetical protein n=1 Tax=Empedobacter brevis TaxID=247 RepID=UPI003340FC8D